MKGDIMTKVQFRRLAVRAIEDACFILFLWVCIWLVASDVGLVFNILGVA